MRIEEWISYDDGQWKEESVGGLGGWFTEDNTWDDYVARCDPDERPYMEAIRDDVLKSGRFITGREHQDSDDGTPLFEDGTVGSFSYRAWGDLMAAIANAMDGQSHHYMEFYC